MTHGTRVLGLLPLAGIVTRELLFFCFFLGSESVEQRGVFVRRFFL